MDRDYYGPESYVKELVNFGGKTPYGDPLFRLILIGKRTIKQAFLWEDWPDDVPYEQRHGIITNPETGRPEASPWRPLRSTIEMREVVYYHDLNPDFWIFERWSPPYESREEWFAPHRCVNGNPDLPKGGPYPSEGAFWAITPDMPRRPELSFCLDYISLFNHNREKMERDLEKYSKQQVANAEWNYKQRREKALANMEDHIRDLLSPITTISLGAGRWRQQMAERAGYRSHIGN